MTDSTVPPSAPPLLALLHRAAHIYGQRMTELMAEAGHTITYAQSQVMGSVPERGIRVTDLAATLGVTKQAASQLVDSLARDGWLEKRPHPGDARAKLVHFGPRGQQALPDAWQALAAVEAAMEARIGEGGLAELRRLLAGIVGSG